MSQPIRRLKLGKSLLQHSIFSMQSMRRPFAFVATLFAVLVFMFFLLSSAEESHKSHVSDVISSFAEDDVQLSSMQDLSGWLSRRFRAKTLLGKMFDVRESTSSLIIPSGFREKALAMFSRSGYTPEQLLQALEAQHVIEVRNRFTGEVAIFNNIRRFRPGSGINGTTTRSAVSEMYTAGSGAEKCDFCSKERTAEDVFGRIRGKYSYTAANVAKISKWHALIITDVHNPLDFREDVISDIINVSHEWFRRVHHEDPLHTYPNIICDIGKRASASQVHLHLQMTLTRDHHFSGMDQLQSSALRYLDHYGSNYWNDLIRLHFMLGLSVEVGRCVILSSICPRKERELLVLCRDPRDSSFARAVAIALMTLRDDVGVNTFSFAFFYPPLDAAGNYQLDHMPAIFRVIERGDALDQRGDTGALEYFGSTYIAADPYTIIPHLLKAKLRLV